MTLDILGNIERRKVRGRLSSVLSPRVCGRRLPPVLRFWKKPSFYQIFMFSFFRCYSFFLFFWIVSSFTVLCPFLAFFFLYWFFGRRLARGSQVIRCDILSPHLFSATRCQLTHIVKHRESLLCCDRDPKPRFSIHWLFAIRVILNILMFRFFTTYSKFSEMPPPTWQLALGGPCADFLVVALVASFLDDSYKSWTTPIFLTQGSFESARQVYK